MKGDPRIKWSIVNLFTTPQGMGYSETQSWTETRDMKAGLVGNRALGKSRASCLTKKKNGHRLVASSHRKAISCQLERRRERHEMDLETSAKEKAQAVRE